MSGAHLHLILNHFPLAGLFFGVVLLIPGVLRANDGMIRAGLIVLFVAGLLTIPTYLAGEPAEKTLKQNPGFNKSRVHEHEEAAEWAAWLMGLTSLCAAGALWRSRIYPLTQSKLVKLTIAVGLFTVTVLARTNNLGGKISHPEIRDEPAETVTTPPPNP